MTREEYIKLVSCISEDLEAAQELNTQVRLLIDRMKKLSRKLDRDIRKQKEALQDMYEQERSWQ